MTRFSRAVLEVKVILLVSVNVCTNVTSSLHFVTIDYDAIDGVVGDTGTPLSLPLNTELKYYYCILGSLTINSLKVMHIFFRCVAWRVSSVYSIGTHD